MRRDKMLPFCLLFVECIMVKGNDSAAAQWLLNTDFPFTFGIDAVEKKAS